ncbi:MAG: GTP-binding protein, partial [Mariprofundaceae bacterium]
MQVKVFSAEKLHEALALVRQEFGPDAVIMDRLEGMDSDGNKIWHVHAALDYEDEKDKPEKKRDLKLNHASKQAFPDSTELFKASMARLERIVEGLGRQESATLRDAIEEHDSRLAFDHLVKLGVAPTHAFDMADDFVQRRPISASVLHWSKRIVPQKKAATVLLVGPSGAGKTTLLAKLATHYSLKGVRVAVLSTDVNRMGGTEMLKSYSDILGIPFFAIR